MGQRLLIFIVITNLFDDYTYILHLRLKITCGTESNSLLSVKYNIHYSHRNRQGQARTVFSKCVIIIIKALKHYFYSLWNDMLKRD